MCLQKNRCVFLVRWFSCPSTVSCDHFFMNISLFFHECFIRLLLVSCHSVMLVSWLALSLRYHNLNPNYIHDRLKLLGQTFTLRVLLVQVDVVSYFSMTLISPICSVGIL